MNVVTRRQKLLAAFIAGSLLVPVSPAHARQVRVRHREGLVHGFLILKNSDGARLASGDLIQTAVGNRVTSRLVFRFGDGSLYDETTIYSERDRFELISDHLIEKGPVFPQPLDMSVDATDGNVTVRYEDHGHEKTDSAHLDSGAGLANGLLLTVLKNAASTPPAGLSLVVATPKPRVLRLTITVAGVESFKTADIHRQATHFVVKAELGGITGALAKLLGKAPPDSHVWIVEGDAPAFVKSEQPLYAGGPLWTIELVSPTWGRDAGAKR